MRRLLFVLVAVAVAFVGCSSPPSGGGPADAGPADAGSSCGPAQDAGTPCPGGLCDGAGTCVPKLGQACAKAADCPSGFCTDGVCCLESCTGECKACNVAGSEGLCRNIPYLMEDASYVNADGVTVNCTTAVGGARCNGMGKCLKTQGTACVDDATCMSDDCSDANKCLGAPGELCDALAECVSNQCVMGTCK